MEVLLELPEEFNVKLYNPETGEVAKIVPYDKLVEVVCKKCCTSSDAAYTAVIAMNALKEGEAIDGTEVRLKPFWLKRIS